MLKDRAAIALRLWGVRGSFPMPGPDSLEFGGHTACVEVRAAGRVLIFDAGTGIVPLGQALLAEGVSEVDLFFSHVHYDHIIGLLFFKYAYLPTVRLRIWAGHMQDGSSPEDLVAGLFRAPYFPITKDFLRCAPEYRRFSPGDVLEPAPGLRLETGALRHPNGAVGYRLSHAGATFAYLTDFEHDNGRGDAEVVRLASHADLALLDAAYTPEEYPRFAGFGHSTWEKCGHLCQRAEVKRWGLFHHMHLRTDAELNLIEQQARAAFPNCFAAREGERFDLARKASGSTPRIARARLKSLTP